MSSECERSCETTLSQSLELIRGDGLTARLTAAGNRLEQLADGEEPDADVVESLYWWALSRPPNGEELDACLQLIARRNDRARALRDIAWALLNTKEFVFRH